MNSYRDLFSKPGKVTVAVWSLLAVHVGLLGHGASIHSPTLNEPGHLVAGISYWKFGRFGVYHVNPPLVRLVAAAPVILAGVQTDWSRFSDAPGVRSEYPLSEDLITANGGRVFWLMTLARWACIPFSVLGGYVCYRWARDLYGYPSGLMALSLWCFCPNILGWGQIITSDIAATALGVASCYTLWRWLKRPTWVRAVVGGGVLGLAQSCKTTFIIFYALWPLSWLIYRWPDRRAWSRRDWSRDLVMLAAQISIAFYVVNLLYCFEGTGRLLGDFPFVSPSLKGMADDSRSSSLVGNRFTHSWMGGLPVPLPENYLLGIDSQRRDFELCRLPSYLGGHYSPRGWWYYYLYALAIKVPLGTWVLIVSATVVAIPQTASRSRRDSLILLCPALLVLGFVSSQLGFTEHTRYVLPALPFLFIWASRVILTRPRIRLLLPILVGTALSWSIASSMLIYPHSLSYFNELGGGPSGGSKHLIGSNIDWGQDLLELKSWLEGHPEVHHLKLAYFGSVDPRHAGIDYEWPPGGDDSENRDGAFFPEPGWYAISINFVRGYSRSVYTGHGGQRLLAERELVRFQNLKPIARAGYSIFIYQVPE